MGKYDILDVAIRKLKVWEKTRELDNGIRHLISGGGTEEVNRWYKEMEEKRTPEQRAIENLQKNAWGDYAKPRKEAMVLIRGVQRQASSRKFYVAAYDGEFQEFRAPNMKLARKFLVVVDSDSYHAKSVLSRAEAFITKMRIGES